MGKGLDEAIDDCEIAVKYGVPFEIWYYNRYGEKYINPVTKAQAEVDKYINPDGTLKDPDMTAYNAAQAEFDEAKQIHDKTWRFAPWKKDAYHEMVRTETNLNIEKEKIDKFRNKIKNANEALDKAILKDAEDREQWSKYNAIYKAEAAEILQIVKDHKKALEDHPKAVEEHQKFCADFFDQNKDNPLLQRLIARENAQTEQERQRVQEREDLSLGY